MGRLTLLRRSYTHRCIAPGEQCLEMFCGDNNVEDESGQVDAEVTDEEEPVQCGSSICGAGEECCNKSCGR